MRRFSLTVYVGTVLAGCIQSSSGQPLPAPASPCSLAAMSPVWSYLRSGTSEVGGVRHVALIYSGMRSHPHWTADMLLPYVAYVDRQGRPQDWLFDSFLWLEIATNDGVHLHHAGQGKRPIVKADWDWLLNAFFDPTHGIGQLEASVSAAGKQLANKQHQVNLVVSMPIPLHNSRDFGVIHPGGPSLDFSNESDRFEAMQWYIRSVLDRFAKLNAKHVRLVGFYLTNETIERGRYTLVRQTADFIHSLGLKLYWIPYFSAEGREVWRQLGIDAAMLQPNYFFTPTDTPQLHKVMADRLAATARQALRSGMGIELEVDSRANRPDFELRYPAYLDAGAKYGYMKDTISAYYAGNKSFLEFATSANPRLRNLYDQTYRYVKGTYQFQGKTPLPELDALPVPKNPKNLALAANGTRIRGTFAHEPGVVPEQLIDGECYRYPVGSEYVAFAWPGYFTLELPSVYTISRTEVLLYRREGRTVDNRTFRYEIELSVDGEHWHRVVDKSQVECLGWQTDRFPPTPARFVRFHGLHSTADKLFRLAEFEVYQ